MSKLTTQLQQARQKIAEKEAESRAWEEEVTSLSQQLREASSKLKVNRNTMHVNCPVLDCAPPSPTFLLPSSLLFFPSPLPFASPPLPLLSLPPFASLPCLPSSPSSFSSHPSYFPPSLLSSHRREAANFIRQQPPCRQSSQSVPLTRTWLKATRRNTREPQQS